MSSDSNLDDELLELAGETQKKRKHSKQGSSSKVKRRKAEDSYSEGEGSGSEEIELENKYPLENKYKDEEDRRRLMAMSEIEREAILAERKEEQQKMEDQRQVAAMLQARNAAVGGDSVSKAAKRQHAIRGATKEKSSKLDELKAKRKAKDERRSRNSPRRERSSSPMEMETDEDDEDGQIGREEQEEERERRLLGALTSSHDDKPITMEELGKVWISRDAIAKHCMAPWFEDYVKGAYVRYLIGNDNGQPVYRVCEILNLSAELVKPYKVNQTDTDQEFDLRHGASVRHFPMDKVSNSPWTEREFDRFVRTCQVDKVKLPSRTTLEKKATQMRKNLDHRLTDSEVSAMLQRKQALRKDTMSHNEFILEKSRLQQLRNFAVKQGEHSKIISLDTQIAALEASVSKALTPAPVPDDTSARLANINERNRKANMVAVRKAEQAGAERKRKERERLLAAKNAPDPKTTDATPEPLVGPLLASSTAVDGSKAKDLHARVLETIEIDLGDFL